MRSVLNEHQQPAVVTTTPHDLLDAFLRSRAREVTEATFARDREVIEWFQAFLEWREHGDPIPDGDELALRRLARSGVSDPAAHLAAERILREIPDFFGLWLSAELQVTALQRSSAGLVIRLLARWLLRVRLVDERKSREVHYFTERFAPISPERRRAGYHPPGATSVRRRFYGR
jgi:hypothetical protein